MKTVQLSQLSRYQWELRSPSGKLIVTDIAFSSRYEAEMWVKSYISSYLAWDYVILSA